MTETISVDGDVVRVDNIAIKDSLVAQMLRGLSPENQIQIFRALVHLGSAVKQFADDKHSSMLLAETLTATTKASQELLESSAEQAREELARTRMEIAADLKTAIDGMVVEIGKNFDPSLDSSALSALSVRLMAEYRRATDKLVSDFDVRNPMSPFAILRAERQRDHESVIGKFAELASREAEKAAAAAERSRSTRKGDDLESALEQFLTGECAPRKDMLRRTSTEVGMDGNRVGDFVIELNPSEASARIVVEAKNADASTTALLREIDKAMHNRGAAFGIAVVTTRRLDVPAIMPFGDDKLIVRVPQIDGSGWDMLALSVALEGARWKSIIGQAMREKVDLSHARSDVDEAFRIANRVTEIKKRVTAGKTHLDTIAESVDDMKRDLMTVLRRVRAAIDVERGDAEAA